jgi:ABC-type sugar transport system ATPase subunit
LKKRKTLASLVLRDVRKSYGDTPVLDGVSLEMEAREFIAFLGPSGSGKSTLLAHLLPGWKPLIRARSG